MNRLACSGILSSSEDNNIILRDSRPDHCHIHISLSFYLPNHYLSYTPCPDIYSSNKLFKDWTFSVAICFGGESWNLLNRAANKICEDFPRDRISSHPMLCDTFLLSYSALRITDHEGCCCKITAITWVLPKLQMCYKKVWVFWISRIRWKVFFIIYMLNVGKESF